jgi:hypothetical protein
MSSIVKAASEKAAVCATRNGGRQLMDGYDHCGGWARTDTGYGWTPDYGGRAVEREPDHPHRLDVDRPEITHEDLELVRQGLPSRTVSHTEIAAAQELMAELHHEGHIQYDTREPGGRLIEAHDNSPEALAMFDAQTELERREAMAKHSDPEAGA